MAHIICPHLGLHPPRTPPELFSSAWTYFTSVPDWRKILYQEVPSPGQLIPFIGRGSFPESPQQNRLVNDLLRRPDGIRHILSFFIAEDDNHTNEKSRPINQTETIFSLGAGLSGFPDIVHGGLIMTLFDEGLGRVIELNRCLGKQFMIDYGPMLTSGMNVKFKKPVFIESEVSVVARLEECAPRLVRIVGEMLGPRREVLATGETTWVVVRGKTKL